MFVMHFENLDIETVIEHCRHLAGQRKQNIDRFAHIGRMHDGCAGARFAQRRLAGRVETGGADDMNAADIRRDFRMFDGGVRQGKFDHCIGLCKHAGRIVAYNYTRRADPREIADIAPNRRTARHIAGGDDDASVGFHDLARDRTTHAASRPHNANRKIRHVGFPHQIQPRRKTLL